MLVKSHEEYQVEEILCARNKAKYKGKGREVLMKWSGHHEKTWEPLENMADTLALDEFEAKYSGAQINNRPKAIYEKSKRKRPECA